MPGICVCVFFGCFLCGVLSANLRLSDEALWIGFVNENHLLQYTRTAGSVREFLFFAFRYRLIPWIVLILSGVFVWGRVFCGAWFGWMGFSDGFVFAALLSRHGAKGILLMGGLGFPHIPIYLFAYAVLAKLIWIISRERKIRKTDVFYVAHQKKYIAIYYLLTALLTGIFLLGVMTEYYVQPWLLEGMSKM